jgi:5'-nucleotidase
LLIASHPAYRLLTGFQYSCAPQAGGNGRRGSESAAAGGSGTDARRSTSPSGALKILISNDDGYRAEGLTHLCDALCELAAVTVVAPDRNRSGASNSLTLDVPLRVFPYGEQRFYVNGTPTDCVHLAISGLFEDEHDMVVSGINDGANLGDVLYSGTVAAAVEGRFLGLPAMAVSLVVESGRHFGTAARVAKDLVMRIQRAPLHPATILNVNVPDLPYESLEGFEVTRLGHRHRSERVVSTTDPRGRPVYWIGPAGQGQDAGPGTDFHAVAHRRVSITPLQIDLTRHAMLDDLKEWIEGRAT